MSMPASDLVSESRPRRFFRTALPGLAILVALDFAAVAGFHALVANDSNPAEAADSKTIVIPGDVSGNINDLDAVVVFCAGVGPYHGMDTTTVQRLQFAARFYREGRVSIVAGIGGHWRVNRIAKQHRGMSYILREAGVSDHAIVQDRESYDTFTNLDEFFALAEKYKWRRVGFVTSPLHMFRVRTLSQWRMMTAVDLTASARVLESAPGAPMLEIIAIPFRAAEQINLWAVWRETHHEWLAWGMTLALPEAIFRDIMRWRRL